MNERENAQRSLFMEAAEITDAAERAAFVERACGDDEPLRRRLERLLKAHDAEGGFSGAEPENGTVLPVTEKPGDRIGRYKLREQIGEGGCGVVYVAEQEEPVRRRVALKVIKLGMDTKQVVARFEAERQALAMMDHPNIAKVLDAGATDTGRPYFVMELVRGIKITDYCDRNTLSTKKRLDLFIQVCRAIQHAHQKGIIHRDIKPSNILVTLHDGVPVPKVIDFGIAKATEGRLTDLTVYTELRQFMGTPAYMSPEQAEMSGLDVDTRSDIYSLGVLLYELLTGRTPFDANTLLQAGLDEMRRIIREEEPIKPSTRLSTLTDADLADAARHRQAEPPRLIHVVRGDLDWIVMKALEKDRTRRYETANGIAMDIERHLNNEPVVARPPTAFYRFRKLVRRNKLAVAAAGAVAMALIVGLGLSTWLYLRERAALKTAADNAGRADQQAKRAEAEAATSRQVAQFMKEMLQGVGASVALGRDTALLKEILDKTAARLGNDLANQPEVEADLRSTLGKVYHDIGDDKKAEAMHREALAIRQRLLGREHADLAESLAGLGNALYGQRRFAEAETLHREALAMRIKMLGSEHVSVASSLNRVGDMLRAQGSLPEAESMHRRAVVMFKKLVGNEHPEVAGALHGLALGIIRQGKVAEAEQIRREVLAMNRKQFGNEHPAVADALRNVAGVLCKQYKLAEAETLYRESLEMRRKLEPEHPDVARTLNGLAGVLEIEDRLAEAEEMYVEARAILKKRLGGEHPDVAENSRMLGLVLCRQGKLTEAEAVFREWIALSEKSPLQPTASDYAREGGWVHNQLGILLRNTGREIEAALELQKANAMWHQVPEYPWITRARRAVEAEPANLYRWRELGDALLDSGKWEAAIESYVRCEGIGSARLWFPLAIAHCQLGHQNEAREWFVKALDSMETQPEIKLRLRQAEAAVILALPDPWGRSQNASNHLKQSQEFELQGEVEKARAAYALATKIYESLAADFPDVAAYRKRLVGAQD